MAQGRRWLKRIGIAVGALFALLIAAAIIIPLVVDVDSYRPQIVKAVNDQINGKFELGKLKLTLWGQIKIEVDGFQLSDGQGRKVVAAKDVYFHVPWLSVFSGSPILTFRMTKPEVQVLKDKSGKMNVLSLMKPGQKAAPAAPAPGGGTGGSVAVPGMVSRARLGIEMRNAGLAYIDASTGLSTQVKDLNVVAKDLSMSRPMEILIWADLDTKMDTLTVRGPAKMAIRGEPKFKGSEFQQIALSIGANMDDIEISMPPMFSKAKGIPANAAASIVATPTTAKIASSSVKFHNAEVLASGEITNLGADPTAANASPVVQLQFKSNEIALKPWSQLVPMLKDYDLAGTASLSGGARGPSDKLDYQAAFAIKALTAKAPTLKAQPRIDMEARVVTDQLQSLNFSMKAPGNDLRVTGRMVSLTAPNANFAVTSTGMDLDQLIDFPKPAPKEKAAPGAPTAGGGGGKSAGGSAAPGSDLDAALDPLRKNKMAAATKAVISYNLAFLKAYNVKMNEIAGQVSFRDLAFAIDRFKMALWSGTIQASGVVQMKPKTPTYRFNAEVANLDLKQAVASQFELFKNTLLGQASFKMEASGASFNPEPAKGNLNGKGSMKVANATFATIDIAKMAGEAINRSINDISAKVPPLKGKKLGNLGNAESRYESVTSDFSIQNGMFSAPNFFAKSIQNQGIDVRGNTQVGIKDYSLRANWELVDTYNLLKARDISIEQAGIRVEHVLAEGDKPVTLPVVVTGTVFSPQPSYTSVPEALAKVAINNVSHAVEGKAKAEAKKQAEEQAKKLIEKAPPKAQEALKGLGKKLFGQ